MLISFSVKNFGVFKEMQTLSFEADNSQQLENYYIVEPQKGLRLLKLMFVYGPNASGKSTLLKALDFVRKLVINPLKQKNESIEYDPFLFDPDTPQQNTEFIVEFIPLSTKIKYRYELTLNRKAVVSEKLLVYNPKAAIVYDRITDTEQQFAQISFGEKAKSSQSTQKALEVNTLWNNTVLGAFSKSNVVIAHLQNVFDWFKDYLKPIIQPQTDLTMYISNRINKTIDPKHLIHLLKAADFPISNLIIKKEPADEKMIALLKRRLSEEVMEKITSVEDLKIENTTIMFEHTTSNGTYQLPYHDESEGTKRYYQLSGLISLIVFNQSFFPIDEVESSLHPDLLLHFVKTVLTNAKHSQILMTTHYREFLQTKDLFRHDAIWFTDKKADGSAELYSLADFDTTTIRDTSSVYNAYKIGKLGAVPDLGDYYLPIEPQKEEQNGEDK